MTARHTSPLEALLVDDAFDGDVYPSEPMARHTMYRIGGPARFYVQVASVGALKRLVTVCEESRVPWVAIGRGSNLLVADEGYPGVVITLGRDFRICRYDEDAHSFCVGAGVPLSSVVQEAFRRSLAGFEFAVGTPGTVGGAAVMNAGAYGGEFKDVAESVRCLTPEGELVDVDAERAQWSYRHSMMGEAGFVVLGATLRLAPDDPRAIRERMDDLARRRAEKQPLELPSAGSTFKRPAGFFVGQLVQEAGLRGYRVGGAQVSEKHTGFVVNAGDATAADVRRLIADVQERVRASAGVDLEPEVRMWGFEE